MHGAVGSTVVDVDMVYVADSLRRQESDLAAELPFMRDIPANSGAGQFVSSQE